MSAARTISQHMGRLLERIEEHERRLRNMMLAGTVTHIDLKKGLLKVKAGDLQSGWVPWTELAGRIRSWSPPSVGQLVHLFSPSGDPGQGFVMPGGFSNANPAPHNKGGEQMIVAGKIILVADEIELRGAVKVTGASLTHRDKNVGDTHRHTDVKPGSAKTGAPAGD